MLYLTLRQYEYVVAVADSGSLTEAALRLHVSQPSLSVAITKVETQLGRPVFARRKGAAIEITPFGHRIISEARELLQRASQIEHSADGQEPFVLACFVDIAPWYLAPALKMLEDGFPSQQFRIREGHFADLVDDLTQGRADMAISYDVGFDDRFNRKTIAKVTPVAYLAPDHSLASLAAITLGELVDYPIILFDEQLSQSYLRRVFDELGLTPQVSQQVKSLEMMRSLAAHDAGIGISYAQPPSSTSYDGRPLACIPISSPQSAAEIVIVWSGLRQQDSQFQQILDHLISSPIRS